MAQQSAREILLHWRKGMRVHGNFTMDVNQYGEHLMRTGKNKQNGRKRKILARQRS